MDHISGVQTSVSRSDRRYRDDDVKKALGVGDFPLEFTRSRVVKKEVPAVPFHSLMPQISTSLQNSEEYLQERKFSTLQARFRDGLRGEYELLAST